MAKLMHFSGLVASLTLFAGCATAPPEPAASPADVSAAATTARTSLPPSTGSRLTPLPSDRTVKAIGNQTFKQDVKINSLGNELGARGN